MKEFFANLSGPKIVLATVLLALVLVALRSLFAGGDPTGGHGHTHDA